jgi:hypothetical protein
MILLGSLLLVVLFSGLSLSNQSVPAQAEGSPTPSVSSENSLPTLQSGDTEGLILGAGIILFIILSGVVIQRIQLKSYEE